MRLQLLRNATLKLDYGGHTILIDPYFAPKHSLESFAGRSPNPMVELPVAIERILDGVELVIVSHLHSDHFDSVAKERVPKHLPLICQPGDEGTISEGGFTDVTPLEDKQVWNGISLTRCPVIGLLIEAPGEPKIYWAGDTVWYPPVERIIAEAAPDVIVTHSCGARWDGDLIVMDAAQTIAVCKAAPYARVIATHMEALDHATVGRQELRRAADAAGIAAAQLLIPEDGATLQLDRPR